MLGQLLSLSETQPPHLSREHIPLGDPAAIYPPLPPARRRQLTLWTDAPECGPRSPCSQPPGGRGATGAFLGLVTEAGG